MNYENNQNNSYEPWDRGEYRTGSTKPPKNRGGLIALLLVTVIVLSGVSGVLGIMNIRLFHQVRSQNTQDSLPIMFSNKDKTGETLSQDPSVEATAAEETDPSYETVSCDTSPASRENTPDPNGLSLQKIYEKVIPSVVSIRSSYRGGSSTGTGVILTEDGYIVTNCHVVENAQQFEVLLCDGKILEAVLVGTDQVTDLAVLQVSAEGLIPAQIGDSSVLRVGDTVVAIGDPLGIELRGTMTDGIVSAINRDIDVDGRVMNLIQTNAALNSGNSGGPLINCYGQVIGINTMKMQSTMYSGDVEGLGFAIPSATVTEIVNQLISQGYVSGRPDLGIIGEPVSEFYQFYYHLPQGLYITEVEEGSSADEVGLESGDILISIGDVTINGSEALQSALYAYEPGDTVSTVVFRGGKYYTVTMTVGEAKN